MPLFIGSSVALLLLVLGVRVGWVWWRDYRPGIVKEDWWDIVWSAAVPLLWWGWRGKFRVEFHSASWMLGVSAFPGLWSPRRVTLVARVGPLAVLWEVPWR